MGADVLNGGLVGAVARQVEGGQAGQDEARHHVEAPARLRVRHEARRRSLVDVLRHTDSDRSLACHQQVTSRALAGH